MAVFVDAGYFFAGGATAISGSSRPRQTLKLNETAAISELRDVASSKSDGGDFLRIYWYDAPPPGGRLGVHHIALAFSDHLKLRLGVLNNAGQQKGVDSLIVTDLIELARNNAITDALLVSGDEDVRIGVQIAQSFGVRVHLLGMEPLRRSLSDLLMQEADTTTEWSAETIRKFLDYVPEERPPAPEADAGTTKEHANEQLDRVVRAVVDQLSTTDIAALEAFWEGQKGLPSDYDRPLLGKCKAAAGRDLDAREKTTMRTLFVKLVRERMSGSE
ncbi:NYN domain-containing protein [Brevundimonas staleyi]|uniref:NYN domain-containing protein n=1 Tax=Brevundimonas staleyi TaxID=74326 RepID=UPI00366E88F6